MPDVLDEYEDEYNSNIAAAKQKIEQAGRCQGHDERRSAAASAERSIDQAKDAVQLMELEVRSLTGAGRTALQSKLRTFRSEIGDLKAQVKQIRSAAQAVATDCIREELFSPLPGGGGRDETSERSSILANNERLGQGVDRLNQAHNVTLQMESTAAAILGDLSKQRQTLLHSRSMLTGGLEQLESARRLLRSMSRRATANKLVLWLIIGFIGALVLLVLWSSFASAPPAAPTPSPRSGT